MSSGGASVSAMPATELKSDLSISLADVVAARERLRGSIYYSPCAHSQMLSAMTGQQVFLKLENLQMTGSFKERGALNRIALLTPEQAERGVVAASAGNHAQGVAYHATKRGIRAVIVMPLATPLVKVTATRGFGAEVVLHGANYDEACEEATRHLRRAGHDLHPSLRRSAVMAGQGTIGLELLEQIEELEAVVVPIGGGGLIGGIACAIKESNPKIARRRRADLAPAFDGGRRRAASSRDARSRDDHRRRHRRAPRGRGHVPCRRDATSTRSSRSTRTRSPPRFLCCSNARRLSPKAQVRRRSPRCCRSEHRCQRAHAPPSSSAAATSTSRC